MSVEVIRTETVFKGRAFEVRQDQVRFPEGPLVQLDVVAHHESVTMLPLDAEGQIWFIHQYRHPAGKELLELPAGVMEEGEDPETAARREVREEIGMGARVLKKLGEFYLAPGYSSEYMHVFLATGLYPAPLQADEDEILRIEKVSIAEAMRRAEAGQIHDAKSLATLFLARVSLGLS